MFFRDDQIGWDAFAISMAIMFFIAPIIMTVHFAHRGEDPAGPDPLVVRGGDLIQFWTGAAVLDANIPSRNLYDREAFRQAYKSVERTDANSRYNPTYPPPIYQGFNALEGLGQIRASKLLLWGFLLAYGLGITLLLRSAGLDLPRGTEGWLLLWAAPASQLGIATGQPAALWLALLGGGLALRQSKRDILAGIVLGILCIKPTVAAPVALALALAAQWRMVGGFVLGGAGVLALSIAADGIEIWAGYVEMLFDTPDLTQRLWFHLNRHVSLRSLVAMPFAGTSWAMPVGVAGGAAAFAFALWLRGKLAPIFARDTHSFPAFALLLGACTFATPHLLDYDLILYYPMMIWAAYQIAEKRAQRARVGIAALIFFYIVPIAYPISEWIHFSVASLALLLLLGWCTAEIDFGGGIEADEG